MPLRSPGLARRRKISLFAARRPSSDLSASFQDVVSSGFSIGSPMNCCLSFSVIFSFLFFEHQCAVFRRSRILLRRRPPVICSLCFIRCLASRLSSGDSFKYVMLGPQSGVSTPNSINCCLSTCVMLFLLLSTFKHKRMR